MEKVQLFVARLQFFLINCNIFREKKCCKLLVQNVVCHLLFRIKRASSIRRRGVSPDSFPGDLTLMLKVLFKFTLTYIWYRLLSQIGFLVVCLVGFQTTESKKILVPNDF